MRPPTLAPRPPPVEARSPTLRLRPTTEPAAHRLYAHVAWTTLGELPLMGPRLAVVVESQVIALCRRLDVEPLEVHAAASRVHLLVRFKPAHSLAEVARRVKEGTGETLARDGSPVRWGRGFVVATVAPGEVRRRLRRLALGRPGEGPPPPVPHRPVRGAVPAGEEAPPSG